jgi:hypothetical protein
VGDQPPSLALRRHPVGKTAEMLGESKPGPRSASWRRWIGWIPPAAAGRSGGSRSDRGSCSGAILAGLRAGGGNRSPHADANFNFQLRY